ncbi:hypothetical protein DXM21_21240 [Agrobacterium rosae]|nr:hypothetical protein DXM21_21240 [Agrobacterium rosae]KAA3516497.1 hypothetical protein DXM25_19445 [Agrobacterium rosae]MQB50297.1 hypothetical protein [Agrobacterium rosae]
MTGWRVTTSICPARNFRTSIYLVSPFPTAA